MAWLEQNSHGRFHVAFRFAGQKLKKSLRTADLQVAQARLQRLKENISLVESGRLVLPDGADLMLFLCQTASSMAKHVGAQTFELSGN